MKKIIVTLLIITLLLTAFACKKPDADKDLYPNVSYYETHLYSGESTNFTVVIVRGQREETLIADGNKGNMVEFATIKVTPLHTDLFNKQYTFKLNGVNGEISGNLTKDMFGIAFKAEVANINTIGELTNITIISDKISDTVELNNKLKDMLDWQDVLNISCKEFKDKIDSEKAAGTFNREIHIKFINNRTDSKSPYYWYVAYITSATDYWALLLDPETGEVISKRS